MFRMGSGGWQRPSNILRSSPKTGELIGYSRAGNRPNTRVDGQLRQGIYRPKYFCPCRTRCTVRPKLRDHPKSTESALLGGYTEVRAHPRSWLQHRESTACPAGNGFHESVRDRNPKLRVRAREIASSGCKVHASICFGEIGRASCRERV